MSMSPCMHCTKVADPRQCEDKNCRLWRRWFIERWDTLRAAPRLELERLPRQPEGVCIGGTHYALPHRVQGYLHSDPCEGCLCPRDLCVLPCRVKRAWQQAREEVYQ